MKAKKILLAIMVIFMFVSSTAILSSCENIEEFIPDMHNHTIELVDEVPATCTTDGIAAHYICSGCEKLFADKEGSAEISAPAVIGKLGHSFTNYASNNDATCTADGTKTAKCDRCDDTDTLVEEGSKLAHSFTNYASNGDATCTADGTKTAKCDNCYKTDTVVDASSKLAHSFTNYVSNGDATCIADGTKTAKCDNCSETDTLTDEDSKIAHSFTNYVSNGDATCTLDGTKTAKCDNCDATDTKVEEGSKVAHSFTNYVSNNDATCTADGTKTAKCDNCDATDTMADEGSKVAHSFTNYVSNGDATCTADGTKTAKCDNCDATDTMADDGSKVAHSFTNYVSNGDATCTADGTKTAKCDNCDATDTKNDEGSMKAHTPADAVQENYVPASCKDNGSYDNVVYCSVEGCNALISRETVVLNATGEHVYVNEIEKVEPKCEEDGYVVKACGCGDEQRTTIPASGHTEVVDEAVAPTCTETGLSEGKHCSACGNTLVPQDVVPAKGHSENPEYVNAVDATPESEGKFAYYACPDCNKAFTDESCTVEATDIVIPKLSLADYTTTTTVVDSVVTTVFTLISDTVEYSVSVVADSYLLINRGSDIYVSEYDYAKLNSDTVTVSYDKVKGYTYSVAEGATESLVNIKVSGASLTLIGEYNIALAAGWVPTNGDLLIGDGDNTAFVTVTNKGIYMYGGNLIVNKGSTLDIPAKTINCEDGSCLIIDGTLNAAGVTITASLAEDASYEYGFIPGLYVRHGVANITGQIKTNSIQVGSEAENACGILNATHSDNNIVVASGTAKIKYVFAAGELKVNNTASSKTGIYANTTGGTIIDIRSGMTMTFGDGISNMLGTWKAGASSYYYYVSVEEGATIEGSGNFFRAGKEGALDISINCWNTVEINIGGETKEVKVVNTKAITAGKASYALSSVSFYTPVEGAVYTATGNKVTCGHLGEFIEATDADGNTIYYQVK